MLEIEVLEVDVKDSLRGNYGCRWVGEKDHLSGRAKLGDWAGGNGKQLFNKYGVSFWGDENVSELGRGGSCTTS